MRLFLLAMCGIPASGKTTLARAILNALDSSVVVEIVSTDDLRDERYYADFRPEREHMVRVQAFERTAQLLRRGVSVIHDDTNYYASMRHELMELAKNSDAAFAVIHVATPLETALEWNERREGPVPAEVVRRIANRLDTPGERYGWDRPLAVVDLSQIDAQSTARLVVERLPSIRPLTQQLTSMMHSTGTRAASLDTLTRRVVAQYLKTHPQMRGSAKISRIRREVLRTGIEDSLSDEEVVSLLEKRLSQK